MKTVLITGANGFIGQNLTRYLNNDSNYNIYATDIDNLNSSNSVVRCNITDRVEVKDLLDSIKPDVIIHLGGLSNPGIEADLWTEFTNVNVLGTHSLLHFCTNKPRFILASSVVIYGNMMEAAYESHVAKPTSVYAYSKLAAEECLALYSNLNRVSAVAMRMCAVVGDGLTHGALCDFIKRIYNNDETFAILGNAPGSQKPYLHIDDLCLAVKKLIESDVQGPFNICNTDCVSIDEIVDLVMKHTGIYKPKKWLGYNFVGDNNKLLVSNLKALTSLGWRPKLNSYEAIEQTIVELIQQQNL